MCHVPNEGKTLCHVPNEGKTLCHVTNSHNIKVQIKCLILYCFHSPEIYTYIQGLFNKFMECYDQMVFIQANCVCWNQETHVTKLHDKLP